MEINNITRGTSVKPTAENNVNRELDNSDKAISDCKTSGDSLDMNDKYNYISEDGDTVELSETADVNSNPTKRIISEKSIKSVSTHLSDAALSKMSKAKLQQLLTAGQISPQQYNKAVKN